MALNTFGWTPAEVTTDSAGNVVAGVTLTVFTDVTKATQVTGLMDKDGTTPLANNVVVSDNKGRFGFKASDAYSLLYVYDGSTADPWPIAAHEALDQGMASHAQAVADAQAAADSAAASAALVGAPAGSAMDTYMGGSAANLVPTVANKVDKSTQMVNVKDYGATGDGTTDDSAAIRSAITAASSARRTVFIPAGTYILSPNGTGTYNYCLPLNYGAKIVGENGATFKVKNNAGNYYGVIGPVADATDMSGLHVENLTIDLNGDNNAVTDYTAQLGGGYARRGIAAFTGSGIRVSRVKFLNGQCIWYAEFLGAGLDSVTIENCTFSNAGSTTLDWDHTTIYMDCSNGKVLNNIITTTKPFAARQAMELHGGPHVASGNHVSGYVYGCDVTGSAYTGAGRSLVKGNTFNDVSIGIDIWSMYAASGAGLNGVVIEGNVITLNHAKRAGVTYCSGVNMNGGSTLPVENLTIRGNIIRLATVGTPNAIDQYSQAICLIRTASGVTDRNIVIADNVIDGAAAGGVAYRSPSGVMDGLRITGNVFRNVGTLGATAFASNLNSGAYISTGTLKGCVISGNQFLDNQATHSIDSGFYLIVPTLSDVQIVDNRVWCADGAVVMHVNAGASTAGQIFLRAATQGWTSPNGRFAANSTVYDEVGNSVFNQFLTAGSSWKSPPRMAYGTAAPTTGTWKTGDEVRNQAPTVGSPKGWVCTAGGAPGTWVSTGNL